MLDHTRLTGERHISSSLATVFGFQSLARGRSFVNQRSNGTQRVSRAWVGVLSVIGLMVAATILGGGAQAAANKFVYMSGTHSLRASIPRSLRTSHDRRRRVIAFS